MAQEIKNRAPADVPSSGPHLKDYTWPLAVILIVVLEFCAVWISGSGRFVALPQFQHDSALLLGLYGAARLFVPVVCMIAISALFESSVRHKMQNTPPGRALLVINFAGLGLLVTLLQLVPKGRVDDPNSLDGLVWVYASIFALFFIVALTIALMIAPVHRLSASERRSLAQRYSIGPALLVLTIGVALLAANNAAPRDSIIPAVRTAVEGTTLNLSLFFYTITGNQMPEISFAANGDPVLQKGDFAIQMAPSCAGYRGMLISVIALSLILALNWTRLRPVRALALGMAAVAAVFVMNAARIALLFSIGVNISEEVAVNGFHNHFGTISLLAIVGVALVILQRPYFERVPAVAGGPGITVERPRPVFEGYGDLAQLLLPLAIMLSVSFTVGSFQGEFNWFYFIPATVGAALMWVMRDRIIEEMKGAPTLAGLFCGVAVYVLWIAMIPPNPERVALFETALGGVALPVLIAWVVIRVLGSSIVVPVLEELAFRAGLTRIITRATGPKLGQPVALVLAVLLSSVAFGLMHADILAATVAGIAYGALAAWRGRIGDAIVAHAVTNFLIAVHVLALGEWSYW